MGVSVETETNEVFLCLCPFHANTDTPAFAVNKHNGLWICYRADCWASTGGRLEILVAKLSKRNPVEALRFIEKRGDESKVPLSSELDNLFAPKRMPILPQMKIDEFKENFWSSVKAQKYMRNRGFEKQTMFDFEVGYDPSVMVKNTYKLSMVIVPIHDTEGNPIGVNGRSIEGKFFKLSKGIPRNEIIFNMHRAKHEPTVIVTESQFDAMRVHQAGYPNVVSFLGSHISPYQYSLLRRYFNKVVILTDNDDAGRKIGHNLAGALKDVRVEWAMSSYDEVYPHGAKDAGDMTDDEIRYCIRNAVPHHEYVS